MSWCGQLHMQDGHDDVGAGSGQLHMQDGHDGVGAGS